MIIKKTDINSIFPIIIKIIKLNFEVVSKLAKSISSIPNIAEVVVLVIVKIDNLNDFSKSILSTIKIPERINKLIKKEIKIKRANYYKLKPKAIEIVADSFREDIKILPKEYDLVF